MEEYKMNGVPVTIDSIIADITIDAQNGVTWNPELYRKQLEQLVALSAIPEGWINVKDGTPELIDSKDYSENVLVINEGILMVMAWCYISGPDEESSGWAWCNCNGDINGDPEHDDNYYPTLWIPLPKSPVK